MNTPATGFFNDMTDFHAEQQDWAGAAERDERAPVQLSRMTFETKRAQEILARILRMLSKKAMTRQEVVAALGMSYNGVLPYMQHLERTRQIYIEQWTREGSPGRQSYIRPRYRKGNLPDAPKIGRYKNPNQWREFMKRVKADPEKYEGTITRLRRREVKRATDHRVRRMKALVESGYAVPGFGPLFPGRVMLGGERKTPSPYQISELVRLRDEGLLWREISEQVGVPQTTARNIYKRMKGG